jgi:amphiphysin
MEQTKSWRDSWASIAHTQLGLVSEYESLLDPIVAASDGHGREMAPTPELQLERTMRLREAYEELKTDLVEEISVIDSRIIQPVSDTRDCITPFRKTIKKRENKRLDYEQSQDRVTKLQRKPGRNPKEDKALAKAEDEFAKAQVVGIPNTHRHPSWTDLEHLKEFNAIDSYIREALPPLVTAAYNIVPPVLGAMIFVQNRLLGVYYTTLHNYCNDFNFPSPPPPMEDVVATWKADYIPVKQEFESIPCIASGKAARQPMRPPDDKTNEARRPSLPPASSPATTAPARSGRIPSTAPSAPNPPLQTRPSFGSNASAANGNHLTPTDFTTASRLGGATPSMSPSTQTRGEYFGRVPSNSTIASNLSDRNDYSSRPGRTPSPAITPTSSATASAIAAKKKKPPPPPPPKRIGTNTRDEFVVAQFAFAGQGDGDLSFREGDRIRIVKKTATDQDWWVGELDGIRGSFPANYCKAA